MTSSGAVKLSARPGRDNNPGDLEGSSFAESKDGPYSVFATPELGWKGLYRQIGLYRDRGLTLAQVIAIYAPANENNTAAYLAAVEARTGLRGSERLADVIPKFDSNHPPLPFGLPGVIGAQPSVLPDVVSFAPLPDSSLDGSGVITYLSDFANSGPQAEIALGVLVAGAVYLLFR